MSLLTVPQPDLRHGVSLGAARLAPVARGGALTSMFIREYCPHPLVPHLTQSPSVSSRQALSLVNLSASMIAAEAGYLVVNGETVLLLLRRQHCRVWGINPQVLWEETCA